MITENFPTFMYKYSSLMQFCLLLERLYMDLLYMCHRNCAAERLYGWKDYEAIGQCYKDILIEEEYVPYINNIREKLCYGQPWTGQFPFKKRSGEIFMALVSETPLYEEGELAGIITVSSDAVVYNHMNSNQSRVPRDDMKRIQWQHRPQIALVPHMASSISDLVLICYFYMPYFVNLLQFLKR